MDLKIANLYRLLARHIGRNNDPAGNPVPEVPEVPEEPHVPEVPEVPEEPIPPMPRVSADTLARFNRKHEISADVCEDAHLSSDDRWTTCEVQLQRNKSEKFTARRRDPCSGWDFKLRCRDNVP